MATSSVAMILASVGEKNTEMTPSETPISRAATTRAAQRAEPADDDDDEGQEQRIAAHQVVRLADRHDQHGGDRRQHRAEREDAGIDAADRNAEGLRGLAVILGGAHDEADPGAGQHEPGGGEQQRSRRR